MTDGTIRAVLFDVGQTILHVRDSVGAVYAETAAGHGIEADPRALDRRFRFAWARSLERARARGHSCSDEILREEWREIVRDTFPSDVPEPVLLPLFEELYSRFSSPRAWTVAPGALESIDALRRLGVRLGVFSNWDSRLPGLLDELGLRSRFDFEVISFEAGFEKPHGEMFRRALELAGTRPEETLVVGDSLDADILPALERGFRTLWVAGTERQAARPDAGPRVAGLPEDAVPFWSSLVHGRLPGLGASHADSSPSAGSGSP